MKKTVLKWVLSSTVLFAAGGAMACGGAASGKHIGEVTAMNSEGKTFTIRDMESRKAITFQANPEIITAVQENKGTVMVNYEENDEGALVAVGVTF